MNFSTWLLSIDPNQIALGTIVTLGIVSLLRGWIIPRSVVVDRMEDKDKQIAALGAERDDWKAAYMKAEEAKAVMTQQTSDLIDGAETTNKLIESLRNRLIPIDQHSTQRQIGS